MNELASVAGAADHRSRTRHRPCHVPALMRRSRHGPAQAALCVLWASVVQLRARVGCVQAVVAGGRSKRATGATDMNEHSSRSHELVTLRITYSDGVREVVSRLNLLDLAGSERVGRSGAAGNTLKEAQSINKSLSALGDVIAALQSGLPHIPYRNSKLTQVLQDSLQGGSKVCPAPCGRVCLAPDAGCHSAAASGFTRVMGACRYCLCVISHQSKQMCRRL